MRESFNAGFKTAQMTDDPTKIAKITAFELKATSIEEASNQIIERLAVYYAILQPEKSFTDDVLKPLINSATGAPAEISYQTFADADHSNQTVGTELKFLITACMFATQAQIEEEEGNLEKAWSCIANAQYQMGVFEGAIIVEPALAHVISSRSKSGSDARNAKYEPLRQEARRLALEGTDDGPFPSRRQAVLAIRDRIVAMSREKQHGVNLVPDNAERTIDGWLKDITFAGKRST